MVRLGHLSKDDPVVARSSLNKRRIAAAENLGWRTAGAGDLDWRTAAAGDLDRRTVTAENFDRRMADENLGRRTAVAEDLKWRSADEDPERSTGAKNLERRQKFAQIRAVVGGREIFDEMQGNEV